MIVKSYSAYDANRSFDQAEKRMVEIHQLDVKLQLMSDNSNGIPHHGSDRNVDPEFFKRVTADHYIVSGNGATETLNRRLSRCYLRPVRAKIYDSHDL